MGLRGSVAERPFLRVPDDSLRARTTLPPTPFVGKSALTCPSPPRLALTPPKKKARRVGASEFDRAMLPKRYHNLFMPELDQEPFSPEEQGIDDEPYAPSYQLSEREVHTTPADPDVETLLKRIEEKHLILRPDFQRTSVWDNTKKSRLVESLLLNLPIPPCFLAEDEDGTRVVVDGQQRLNSIDDFYHGRYALSGLQVLKDLNGKKWAELPPKLDRKILQRVIRTLVISHHSNPGIRFEIFERLNSGGEPLTEQEIRNATLRGEFNKLLNQIANSPDFLVSMHVKKPDPRLRHHELVLRFFAVRAALKDYRPPLKMILSEYMRENREPGAEAIQRLKNLFFKALENSRIVFGDDLFRRYREKDGQLGFETAVSKSVFELQMLSLSFLETTDVTPRAADIKSAFMNLSTTVSEFSESLSRATDHRKRFYNRVDLWGARLQALGLVSELNSILISRVP